MGFLARLFGLGPKSAEQHHNRRGSQEETEVQGIRFVCIPAGRFLMGSPKDDKDALPYERPQHKVRITRGFYLAKYPVTQEQYERVMCRNPSHFRGAHHPVDSVLWDDAMEFCLALSAEARQKVRLPTEAEWEYACRAGSQTRYCFGDSASQLGDYAWFKANSGGQTHVVGQKKPNGWALFDMHGNIWEWCADWYDVGYYASSPVDDPKGPREPEPLRSGLLTLAYGGASRVCRGGSFGNYASMCSSAFRSCGPPFPDAALGFRPLMERGA